MSEHEIVTLKPEEWVWWLGDDELFDVDSICNSLEECIEDAQERYDNHDDPFCEEDDERPNLISIGSVQHFSLRDALKSSTESILDHVIDQMDDFTLGTGEVWNEYDGPADKEENEKFREEVADALLPIFDKYCSGSNPMTTMPVKGFYDLKRHCWVDEHSLEPIDKQQ